MAKAQMPIPVQDQLALAELQDLIEAVPCPLEWKVINPGECESHSYQLTLVPFFVFPIKGSIKLVLQGSTEIIHPGQALCFLPHSHATLFPNGDGEKLRITIDKPFLYAARENISKYKPGRKSWDTPTLGCTLNRTQQLWDPILERAAETKGAHWQQDLCAASWQLISEWIQQLKNSPSQRPPQTWDTIVDFVKAHLADSIYRKSIAQAVGLHPNYISNLCRQHTGLSLTDWISQQRFDRVKQLLLETNLTIREIGHSVGWDSDGYLSKRFQKAYGVTPLRWRKQNRKA